MMVSSERAPGDTTAAVAAADGAQRPFATLSPLLLPSAPRLQARQRLCVGAAGGGYLLLAWPHEFAVT